MKGIILAAGYGTRLGALGRKLPKALLEVGGHPVIDYLLKQYADLGIGDVVIVTNARFFEAFQNWRNHTDPPVAVTLINDGSTDPENRLGAVRDLDRALSEVDSREDVFVGASDNLYTGDLSVLLRRFNEVRQPVVALIRQDDKAVLQRSGVATIASDGRMTGFVEKPDTPPSSFAAPPLYLYPRDIRSDIQAFLSEPGVDHDAPGNLVAYLVERRTVYGVVLDGKRHDIGDLESYRHIRDSFTEPPRPV